MSAPIGMRHERQSRYEISLVTSSHSRDYQVEGIRGSCFRDWSALLPCAPHPSEVGARLPPARPTSEGNSHEGKDHSGPRVKVVKHVRRTGFHVIGLARVKGEAHH
jgi:hypothetical protein